MKNLDWGHLLTSGFNQQKNEALFVYNFDLTSMEKINDIVVFIASRIFWAESQLPQGCSQIIYFDIRGQEISDENLSYLISEISKVIEPRNRNNLNYSVNFKTF